MPCNWFSTKIYCFHEGLLTQFWIFALNISVCINTVHQGNRYPAARNSASPQKPLRSSSIQQENRYYSPGCWWLGADQAMTEFTDAYMRLSVVMGYNKYGLTVLSGIELCHVISKVCPHSACQTKIIWPPLIRSMNQPKVTISLR